MNRRFEFFKRFLLVAWATTSMATASAHAGMGDLYFETGFGLSKIRNGSLALDSSFSDSPGFGLGGAFTLAYNITAPSSLLQVHVGIKDRVSTSGDDNGNSYMLHSIYPVIRLETPRIYIGGGLTPYLFKRPGGLGFSGFEKIESSMGYFTELGLLWRVVNYFHVSIESSLYFFSTPRGTSPSMALDFTFNMRFFLYNETGSGAGAGGRQYDGWRYPFGIEIGGK
ncbi:MAG: hypothetical protein AB7P04_12315 [Bacteriovoracia bacterium]